MEQIDIDTAKAKLDVIKQQSEAIPCLYSAFVDKVMGEIENSGNTESTNIADVNAKLDVVSGFLAEKYEESCRLMSELVAPGDDEPEASTTRSLLPESQTALPPQDSRQYGLMSELVAPGDDEPEASTTRSLLPESQTALPPQDSRQYDLAQLTFRLKALETAMSKLTDRVQEDILSLKSDKKEQESTIQTAVETLCSLISCEIDNLDVKLQQQILNCSDKLDFQAWDIRGAKNQISSMQTAGSDVRLWQHMTSELTSRLYTLEATTSRFIKEQTSRVRTLEATANRFITEQNNQVNTQLPAQVNDTGIKDDK